jgi:hypothetical protein
LLSLSLSLCLSVSRFYLLLIWVSFISSDELFSWEITYF